MRKATGWLLVAAVASIALAAGLHALVDRGSDPPGALEADLLGRSGPDPRGLIALDGPDAPQPGALSGTLLVVLVDGCRFAELDLATLKLGEPTLASACGVAISPDRARAVVSLPAEGASGNARLRLAELGSSPRLDGELGVARGRARWSPDGRRVAWCGPSGSTVVFTLSSGRTEIVPGCTPTFAASGELLTLDGFPRRAAVLRDGAAVLEGLSVRSESTSTPAIPLGVDQRADGLLAVTVTGGAGERGAREFAQPGPFGALARESSTSTEVELQLWRGVVLEQLIRLPRVAYRDSQTRFGDVVEFSPDGTEVAVSAGRSGTQLVVVDVRSGRTVLPPTSQLGFAWSPDGAWLALADGHEITVSGPLRDEPVYRLAVPAAGLAWR